MYKRFWNFWIKKKTKNYTEIPLFVMLFNYKQYKEQGKAGSCQFWCHPDIANDEFVKEKLSEVVDYIRDSYDLDKFTKID